MAIFGCFAQKELLLVRGCTLMVMVPYTGPRFRQCVILSQPLATFQLANPETLVMIHFADRFRHEKKL
jgi:hypothetical protein